MGIGIITSKSWDIIGSCGTLAVLGGTVADEHIHDIQRAFECYRTPREGFKIFNGGRRIGPE